MLYKHRHKWMCIKRAFQELMYYTFLAWIQRKWHEEGKGRGAYEVMNYDSKALHKKKKNISIVLDETLRRKRQCYLSISQSPSS